MYESFERAVRRVSDRIQIGGPALAYNMRFLGEFLDFVREEQKFNSLEELRNQIAIDKIAVQKAYDSIINNRPSL